MSARAASEGGVSITKTDAGEIMLSGKDLALYSIRARTYEAEIFLNGRVRVLAGGAELIRNLVLQQGRKPLVLGDIRSTKHGRISLHEGEVQKPQEDFFGDDEAEGDGLLGGIGETSVVKVTQNLPGIVVSFAADAIEVEFLGLWWKKRRNPKTGKEEMPEPFTLAGLLGDGAVEVRNLRNGDVDALPTQRVCGRHMFSFYGWLGHYWPDIEVTYLDGRRLEVRGLSGIDHYRIGARDPYKNEKLKGVRGFWSVGDAKKETKVTIRIAPGGGVEPMGPAPYYGLRMDKPRGIFYENERVLCHLDLADGYVVPGRWKLAWTLEDHRQRPAGRGEREITLGSGGATKIEVDLTPQGMGYHRARLVMTRADPRSARRVHEFSFARIRPERPELRDLDGRRGVDSGFLWANILGMRGFRKVPAGFARIWTEYAADDGTIDWKPYEEKLRGWMDLARKGTVTTVFSFIGLEWSDDVEKWFRDRYPGEEERKRKIKEAKRAYLVGFARACAKVGIDAFEPVNEPNLGMSGEGYIENILKVQYPAIREGNPRANFLGGSICGLNNHGWVRALYEKKGDAFFDGISFHPYTGGGFQEAYRAEIDSWWRIMRDFKDDPGQGLWMTESAWHRGWGFNDYVYDRFNARRESQALNGVHMFLHAEGMGIPRDRVYAFYFVEHGYNDFYLMRRTEPTSAAIAMQVMNERLGDAKFANEVPLPGKGHYFQVYRGDDRTVAVAFTGDEPAELEVLTDAETVSLTDLMGNRRSVKPKGGRFSLTMRGDPTYMTAGPGSSMLPGYDGLHVQPNLAIPTLGARASASVNPAPAGSGEKKRGKPGLPPLGPDAAISGDWTCYGSTGAYDGRAFGWGEAGHGKDTFPDWFEVRLPRPAQVARVRVYHDYRAWEKTLRDYDVQVFADGEWKTVDTVRGNYYPNVCDHRFDPVVTDRVRVLIRMVNACLFEEISWIPKTSMLRAVEVYGRPEGKAKAFFVQEIPRKRVVRPGGKTDLTFRLKNITETELSGEVRLILPDGVTAEVTRRQATLAPWVARAPEPLRRPGGEAAFTFTVRAAAGAAQGLYTVLAGLYEGETLVSSEYAARVLCCKNPPPPKKRPRKRPEQKGPARQKEKTPEPDGDDDVGPRDALDVMLEEDEDDEP
jgi:hypothetical protein